ncbi:MAG: aldo/keto reductase, partial [Nocardioidaceae bacterium]
MTGVNVICAATLVAAIGDIRRFRSPATGRWRARARGASPPTRRVAGRSVCADHVKPEAPRAGRPQPGCRPAGRGATGGSARIPIRGRRAVGSCVARPAAEGPTTTGSSGRERDALSPVGPYRARGFGGRAGHLAAQGEWGKHFTQRGVDALVGRAGELGVNLLDTAECYGDHLAESLVGRAIAAERERWVVATKLGHRFHAERMREPGWDPVAVRTDHWSPREVVGQLEDSLRALGTDYVDVYQSHGGSDTEFETPRLWEALQDQVRAGKVRHLGISLDPDDGARAERAPEVGAGVIQVTYNRLNRVAEER